MGCRAVRDRARPRRTQLLWVGTLIAILALSGCSRPGDKPPATPGSPTAAPSGPAVEESADALLAGVTQEQAALDALVAAHPKLTERTAVLRGVLAAQAAFLSTLATPTGDPTASPTPAPAIIAEARDQVRVSATALIAAYAEAAAAEPDPALARAFASLAAGTAQGLVAGRWESPLTPVAATDAIDPTTAALAPAEVDALQRVLAMEHAALWSYGVLGANTSASDNPALFEAITAGYQAHRTLRDELDGLLRDLGLEPVAAEVGYVFEHPLGTPRQVAAAARALESDTAATYSWLVAQVDADPDSGGGLRRWALTALGNAAIRELVAQGTPENFPGADELADR